MAEVSKNQRTIQCKGRSLHVCETAAKKADSESVSAFKDAANGIYNFNPHISGAVSDVPIELFTCREATRTPAEQKQYNDLDVANYTRLDNSILIPEDRLKNWHSGKNLDGSEKTSFEPGSSKSEETPLSSFEEQKAIKRVQEIDEYLLSDVETSLPGELKKKMAKERVELSNKLPLLVNEKVDFNNTVQSSILHETGHAFNELPSSYEEQKLVSRWKEVRKYLDSDVIDTYVPKILKEKLQKEEKQLIENWYETKPRYSDKKPFSDAYKKDLNNLEKTKNINEDYYKGLRLENSYYLRDYWGNGKDEAFAETFGINVNKDDFACNSISFRNIFKNSIETTGQIMKEY